MDRVDFCSWPGFFCSHWVRHGVSSKSSGGDKFFGGAEGHFRMAGGDGGCISGWSEELRGISEWSEGTEMHSGWSGELRDLG